MKNNWFEKFSFIENQMFSRNGQYFIDEFEEDTFDKQLPSSSVKVPFKKEKEKIFNRMQEKYELELLK